MSKEDVIDYVMTTPSNPNRAVLSGMLDEVSGTQLPSPTASDNGKVLGVDGGEYKLVEQSGGNDYTNISNSGNGTTIVKVGKLAIALGNTSNGIAIPTQASGGYPQPDNAKIDASFYGNGQTLGQGIDKDGNPMSVITANGVIFALQKTGQPYSDVAFFWGTFAYVCAE